MSVATRSAPEVTDGENEKNSEKIINKKIVTNIQRITFFLVNLCYV